MQRKFGRLLLVRDDVKNALQEKAVHATKQKEENREKT
jgi:hypothetical protein